MALGVIELATIARSQDYTAVKHTEDNKGVAQQNNVAQNMQQQVEQKARQVRQGDNTEWQNKKFDAKEKGNGSYEGNSRDKKKEKKPEEKVLTKGRQGFDIKI